MDDLSITIQKEIDSLKDRIDQKRMLIAIANTLENNKYDYTAVLNFYVIVNNCIQLGNYRRACRFIILANTIMNDIEKNEKHYIEQLTSYIAKE